MKYLLPIFLLLSSCATKEHMNSGGQPPELVPLDLVFPPGTIEYISTDNEPIRKVFDEPIFELYVVKKACSGIGYDPEDPEWEPHCTGVVRFPVCVPKTSALGYGISSKTLKKAKLCNDT